MSLKIDERNQRINAYLKKFYELAEKQTKEGHNNSNSNAPSSADSISKNEQLLIEIFDSKTISYREIILVSLVAKYLDNDFSAYSNFYGCKPRSIFEGPIKNFMINHGFPHTKSGPLNIAKASNINEAWSSQRDPKEDALKVVELVKEIDKGVETTNNLLATDLMAMYINKAELIENLSVSIKPDADPFYLSALCKNMIDEAPDAGNTPQRIFGYMLKAYNSCPNTNKIVTGTEDSASTTSTTSKKPGDINEELPDGTILKVYEVTIKHFNLPRIKDSYDCVSKYNSEHGTSIKEIIVVCRKNDCPTEMNALDGGLCMGSYNYQDTIYYFWDIYEWISYTFQHMTMEARKLFYDDFNNYISDPNTHENVKVKWLELHS